MAQCSMFPNNTSLVTLCFTNLKEMFIPPLIQHWHLDKLILNDIYYKNALIIKYKLLIIEVSNRQYIYNHAITRVLFSESLFHSYG